MAKQKAKAPIDLVKPQDAIDSGMDMGFIFGDMGIPQPEKRELPAEVKMAMKTLDKDHGANTLMLLGDNPEFVDIKKQTPSGSLALDIAIGAIRAKDGGGFSHGIPSGRTIEIFGPESCGKTTLCNSIIAQSQRRGGLCAFIDMEQAWDKFYAARLGVDTTNLLISQPDYGEQALEILEVLVRSGKLDVIVVDSIASLVPLAEYEGSITDNSMALQARMMSQCLRMLTPVIRASGTTVIFTNQIRYKVGRIFGSPETTPGGKAMRFYATLRLDMRPSDKIKNSAQELIGHMVKLKVAKNKIAPPFKVAHFPMIYGRGIDKFHEIIEIASTFGIVTKKGSWFYYGDVALGQGMNNAKATLEEEDNGPMRKEIYEAIMNKFLRESV
jgi:recombination protein RecA